ncbi:MAG TPA: DUF3179 domain-containing (seleno)protein [Candidatus Limnocylindrales bacterium]|nr:DUF3179 domain-containing (seleno)protein [Candidatus Limnocylindrales bacterium]
MTAPRPARRGGAVRRILASAVASVVVAAACVPQLGGPAGASPAPDPSGPSPTRADASGSPADRPPVGVDPERLRVSTEGWATDFTIASVDLAEFRSGGPPPDGIPSIDDPRFESVDAAATWLTERSPVIALEIAGDARAYPLAILLYHEIVNDTVGGRSVVVTFCPLCNTSLVFVRTLPDGTVLDFGTTGNLRLSDLVMYDRQTESWWQQAIGEALVGELTGTRLEFLPTQVIALADFAAAHPDGRVLSRETGHRMPYGRNPYPGYDDPDSRAFLFEGVLDGRIAAKERVVALEADGDQVAVPFSEIERVGAALVEVGASRVLVVWQPGASSPLDLPDVEGRDVGAVGVFVPAVDGRALTFRPATGAGAAIVDEETGTAWSVTGTALEGPLVGRRLEPVAHGTHFWFAWAAFAPGTRIWTADAASASPDPSAAGDAAATAPEARGSSPASPSVPPAGPELAVTLPVRSIRVVAGQAASLVALSDPGATCGISVVYGPGPRKAAGLQTRPTDTAGYVRWLWTVDPATPQGSWPVIVTCRLADAEGEAGGTLTVE